MIRRSDLIICNLTFCMISFLGFLPISFIWETGKIRVHAESGARKIVWRFWQVQSLVYSLFMIFRLFQYTVMDGAVEFNHYAFHMGMVVFSISMNFWTISLIQWTPAETEAIFNNNLSNCDFREFFLQYFKSFQTSLKLPCTQNSSGRFFFFLNYSEIT